MTSGAFALTFTDVAIFTPPHRSNRPERRSKGDERIVTKFAAFRRELAKAAEMAGMPFRRIGHNTH